MGLFKRRRDPSSASPPFQSPGDEQAFRAQVGRALDARGVDFSFEADGAVMAAVGTFTARLGLHNLADACAEADVSQWPHLVDAHFDTVLRTLVNPPEELDYATARGLLRQRIWTTDDVGDLPALHRAVADGLRAVVCLDLPDTIQAVAAGDLARWARPDEELFEIAASNVRAEVPLEVGEHDVGDGIRVSSFSGSDLCTTTHVLWADRLVPGLGEHGAIVAVPTRNTILVYPIAGAEVRTAAKAVLLLTVQVFDEGPGSLSPDIYWWHDGELGTQPAIRDGDSLALGARPDFLEMLNAVAA